MASMVRHLKNNNNKLKDRVLYNQHPYHTWLLWCSDLTQGSILLSYAQGCMGLYSNVT